MFCPKCGHNNKAEAHFCASCGTKLPVRGKTQTTQPQQQPELTPTSNLVAKTRKHGYKILVIALCVIMAVAFICVTLYSYGEIKDCFLGLTFWPALLGTSVFFACAIIPISLAFLAIIALARAIYEPTIKCISAASFPIIAALIICVIVIVGHFIFITDVTNDMSLALQTTFDAFFSSAIIGIFASIGAFAVIKHSNKKTN